VFLVCLFRSRNEEEDVFGARTLNLQPALLGPKLPVRACVMGVLSALGNQEML
jgi:hypothetical protein